MSPGDLTGPASQYDGETRDTPAEVDAAFRTLRRIAVTYFIVFLVVVAAFPVLTLTLDWWLDSRLIGSLSPGFLTVAVGLYVVFAGIGIAAATLSSSVEQRMLGSQSDEDFRPEGRGRGTRPRGERGSPAAGTSDFRPEGRGRGTRPRGERGSPAAGTSTGATR
ncbi:DUF485 domain-containing protein [Nesterenkonia ebinurensis]|uniref:hypothetical protein n=1 Tax=Nesterenkonia ebinurensis TaxID=2608252 RepID=UPI00168B9769|nr:hypothetical protein [Nesterenkonia ebinurensis]